MFYNIIYQLNYKTLSFFCPFDLSDSTKSPKFVNLKIGGTKTYDL